jgi:hypothetical protein
LIAERESVFLRQRKDRRVETDAGKGVVDVRLEVFKGSIETDERFSDMNKRYRREYLQIVDCLL